MGDVSVQERCMREISVFYQYEACDMTCQGGCVLGKRYRSMRRVACECSGVWARRKLHDI